MTSCVSSLTPPYFFHIAGLFWSQGQTPYIPSISVSVSSSSRADPFSKGAHTSSCNGVIDSLRQSNIWSAFTFSQLSYLFAKLVYLNWNPEKVCRCGQLIGLNFFNLYSPIRTFSFTLCNPFHWNKLLPRDIFKSSIVSVHSVIFFVEDRKLAW